MSLITIILLLSISINYSEGSFNDDLKVTVEKLKARSKEMFGEVEVEVDTSDFDELTLYPQQNKTKLSIISQQWLKYYDCAARVVDDLTVSGAMPSRFVVSYVGGHAELPCGLCVAPNERGLVTWRIAKSLQNLTFTQFYAKETVVLERDGTMKMFFVREEDGAVYRCQIGDSVSGLVVLEVLDEHNYTIVKPPTSHGPYPAPPLTNNDLIVHTVWDRWSECSACDRVGRKRRYGMCFVRREECLENEYDGPKNRSTHEARSRALFEAFPNGIPCRSLYLPVNIRTLDDIQKRPNEIMIAMCKIPCKSLPMFVTSLNSFGTQILQPPEPAREIVFAVRGRRLVIHCPGTSLRNMPVRWMAGTRRVSPAHLYAASEGRLSVTARDQLVFTAVASSDRHLYSCWQSDTLVGTVKLEVWSGGNIQWNIHLVLVLLCVVCAILLRVAVCMLRRQKRRLGIA